MKNPSIRLCAVVLGALLSLSGCGIRSRVIPETSLPAMQQAGGSAPAAGESPVDAQTGAAPAEPSAESRSDASDEPDPHAPSRHDPTAERREYHEHASAELVEGEENKLLLAGEKQLAIHLAGEDRANADTAQEAESAALKAMERLSQQEAERLGISEEAPLADSVFQFYQTLLETKVGSLFECKRLYVYWETPTAYQTVFKTSPEHHVILRAGGYDVAAKRKEDALTVDDGWIERKAPGCIVKCVNASVLGKDVHSTRAAQDMLSSLLARPGWHAMAAVRTKTVILLSEELLHTRWGQLAAALYLAQAMYPDEMAEVDPDEALRLLAQEATGAEINGIFCYTETGMMPVASPTK